MENDPKYLTEAQRQDQANNAAEMDTEDANLRPVQKVGAYTMVQASIAGLVLLDAIAYATNSGDGWAGLLTIWMTIFVFPWLLLVNLFTHWSHKRLGAEYRTKLLLLKIGSALIIANVLLLYLGRD